MANTIAMAFSPATTACAGGLTGDRTLIWSTLARPGSTTICLPNAMQHQLTSTSLYPAAANLHAWSQINIKPAKLVCSALNSVDQKGASLEDGVLEALRELVGQLGGDVEDADDMELMRFLKARSMDLEVAAEAFITHKKWRSENVPNGKFTEADLPTELDAKKLYWIPQDIKGRPVLLTLGRNHVYNKQDFDEFTRVLVYALDKSIARAPPTTQNFLAIVDLKGLGVKNLDSKSFIAAFELVEKHYPDRIDKIFMINVPFIFNGLWKVVSRFIDEGTKSKIIFVDNKKLTETLLTEIELEYLPAEYGGKADLLLLQDA